MKNILERLTPQLSKLFGHIFNNLKYKCQQLQKWKVQQEKNSQKTVWNALHDSLVQVFAVSKEYNVSGRFLNFLEKTIKLWTSYFF